MVDLANPNDSEDWLEMVDNGDLYKCISCGLFWMELDAADLCQKCQQTRFPEARPMREAASSPAG